MMAGITLAQAEAKLALWMGAEEALATSQSYEIDVDGSRRKLVRSDLGEIARRITYWNKMVQKLTAQTTRASRSRMIVN